MQQFRRRAASLVHERTAVKQVDLMTERGEPPGGHNAIDAAANYGNMHRTLVTANMNDARGDDHEYCNLVSRSPGWPPYRLLLTLRAPRGDVRRRVPLRCRGHGVHSRLTWLGIRHPEYMSDLLD